MVKINGTEYNGDWKLEQGKDSWTVYFYFHNKAPLSAMMVGKHMNIAFGKYKGSAKLVMRMPNELGFYSENVLFEREEV